MIAFSQVYSENNTQHESYGNLQGSKEGEAGTVGAKADVVAEDSRQQERGLEDICGVSWTPHITGLMSRKVSVAVGLSLCGRD